MRAIAPIARAALAPTAVMLALLSTAACSSDDEATADAAPTTVGAVASTTTVVPSTTTAAAPTTTAPLRTYPTPGDAGAALFAAWTSGARPLVDGAAPPVELDELFAARPRPDAKNRGCDDGAFGSASCFFGNGQGGVNVSLTPGPAGGWVVVAIDPFG